MEKVYVSVYLPVVLLGFCSPGNGQPQVQSPAGTFLGVENSLTINGQNYKVNKYLGIPYAEPPVGDLRFKKPVAKSPLTETFNATQFGAACNQVAQEGVVPLPVAISEDCLFLNVYVPAGTTSQKPVTGYSVMVWIHGGGFLSGESKTYRADTFSAYGDVIVVTFNYRLAVLGFFSTGDQNAPGNYGLWDQHLAIRWVHDNIASFGGDTNKVTIFGESAGAISVLLQASYPGNIGLFQRVITESGAPTCPFGFSEKSPLNSARFLAHTIGCNNSFSINTSEIVDCLRNFTNEAIFEAIKNLYARPAPQLILMPIFDNDFITISPSDFVKLTNGQYTSGHTFFASLDLMTGINSKEGGLFISPSLGVTDIENFEVSRAAMGVAVRAGISARLGNDIYPDVLNDVASATYTDWQRPDDAIALRDLYVELFGDVYFFMPALEYSKKRAKLNANGNNYLFQFAAEPSKHLINTPSWLKGANHGDELQFVFGFDPDFMQEFTLPGNPVASPEPWEYALSRFMMTMMTNFAKTGNPNTPRDVTALGNVTWPSYTLDDQTYLNIDRMTSSDSVKQRLAAKADHLWLTITPQILERCTPNRPVVASASTRLPMLLLTVVSVSIGSVTSMSH